ncbi:MAG: DctP family TRAP transporter solute-binding subunit [Candidatus Aminicenantes bacterium]|nr:DctP family TRAP transporter solute-binding subunit [Candidatus Aminicenantes bacterium]
MCLIDHPDNTACLFSRVLLIGLISIWSLTCGFNQPYQTLKLAHVLDTSHPVHKAMTFMADKVSQYSDGQLRIDIYPSGQLGQERELIELLQIGSLAMTKVSTAPLESFIPEMKVLGIPYIFRDEAHRWEVLTGSIGQSLLLSGERCFLRGLCFYDAGSRSFYTKNIPIHTPSDLNGLKIRVMKSATSVNMVKALGGSPTPISWGELYTALQQGVVDGAENNPPSFYLSHHYEVCQYYTLDEHTCVPDILLISTSVWSDLNSQEQKWLQKAAEESVDYQRELWKKATQTALQEVQKSGVEIIYPDKTAFVQAAEKMHNKYRGTDLFQWIKKIKTIK